MNDKLSLFDRVIFEAPGDDPPPDIPTEGSPPPDNSPPDMNEDISDPPDLQGGEGDSPPDIDNGVDPNGPPDMGGDEFADGDQEDQGFDDGADEDNEEDPNQNFSFDEKISGIMNIRLYQRFLSLLNNIGGQLSMIKNNSDMLYTLSNDSLNIIESLKKLDENVRLYLTNYFLNENYSKNLLFFNKCLNLLELLNIIFEKNIQKGIKSME